jgi:hypothetical protein
MIKNQAAETIQFNANIYFNQKVWKSLKYILLIIETHNGDASPANIKHSRNCFHKWTDRYNFFYDKWNEIPDVEHKQGTVEMWPCHRQIMLAVQEGKNMMWRFIGQKTDHG